MLTLEHIDMLHSENWKPRCIDPDEGFYRQKDNKNRLHLTILRLFYVLGEPTGEQIGTK